MPTSSLMRSPVRGLGLVALTLWLGAGAKAVASGIDAARPGSTRGTGLPLLLAKAKKKRRPAPAGDKSSDGSSADSGSDEEAPERSRPAPERAKPDDDADTGAGKGDDDAERPAPKRKRSRTTAEDSKTEAGVEAKAEAKSEDKSDESPSVSGASATALELGFGAAALFRSLAYTADAGAAGLGAYSLSPGPEAGLWLEFYPAAFATPGFAGNIGLFARYAHGFGVTSYTPMSGEVGTTYQDFLGGLKVRFPLGTFAPYATVAYGEQTFGLTGAGTQLAPAMDYTFLRVGGGTRIHIAAPASLDVSAAFLSVTGAGGEAGQVASNAYFPGTKALAVDLGISAAVRLTSSIGLRGGVDFRQYGLAFHPGAGTKPIAGATDRYIVTFAGLEVILDGQAASATSPPPAPSDEKSDKKQNSDDGKSEPKSDKDET
jgi:hypothetical protein